MRLGGRRQRWKTASAIEGILFTGAATFIFAGVDGPAKYIIGGVLALMAILAFRDYRLGWKMRYDLPPRGRDAIARGDPKAIAAWDDTQLLAQTRGRQRRAFRR